MVKEKNFAPVVIPTLCRYEHFRRCVESLERCTYADKTELIIGLDYPLNDSHFDGYNKILDYLENEITGFRKVTVIKHSQNQGALINYHKTLDYAFRTYDRVIVTEDDNEFSPNFLDYINKGLDLYENSEEVVSICGYNYPVEMKDYDGNAYLSHNHSAWGFGMWKFKNEKYLRELPLEKTCKIMKSPGQLLKILAKKPTLAISLWYMRKQKIMLGDVNREIYNIIGKHYCLFPRESLVRNWGHDGSGINCGDFNNEIYLEQEIDSNSSFDFNQEIKILPKKYNKRLRKFFGDRPQDLFLRSCRYIKRRIFK